MSAHPQLIKNKYPHVPSGFKGGNWDHADSLAKNAQINYLRNLKGYMETNELEVITPDLIDTKIKELEEQK